jgi:hypothetical protein
MEFGPEYIKKLIAEAHALLEQDDVGEVNKRAIDDCLKSIQDYEELQSSGR